MSPGAVTGMVSRVAAALGACPDASRQALVAAPVARFDETGSRVVWKLAWTHWVSLGKCALILTAVTGWAGTVCATSVYCGNCRP